MIWGQINSNSFKNRREHLNLNPSLVGLTRIMTCIAWCSEEHVAKVRKEMAMPLSDREIPSSSYRTPYYSFELFSKLQAQLGMVLWLKPKRWTELKGFNKIVIKWKIKLQTYWNLPLYYWLVSTYIIELLLLAASYNLRSYTPI